MTSSTPTMVEAAAKGAAMSAAAQVEAAAIKAGCNAKCNAENCDYPVCANDHLCQEDIKMVRAALAAAQAGAPDWQQLEEWIVMADNRLEVADCPGCVDVARSYLQEALTTIRSLRPPAAQAGAPEIEHIEALRKKVLVRYYAVEERSQARVELGIVLDLIAAISVLRPLAAQAESAQQDSLLVRNPAPDAAPPSIPTGITGTYKIGYTPPPSASEPAGALADRLAGIKATPVSGSREQPDHKWRVFVGMIDEDERDLIVDALRRVSEPAPSEEAVRRLLDHALLVIERTGHMNFVVRGKPFKTYMALLRQERKE